jgi:glycine/D-amino acid oxidase-like deaminating enzyme
MLSDTGRTESLWMVTRPPQTPAPLRQDAQTQVCVIGVGIAGIATAYNLAQAGKRVVVLEDGAVGGGETGRTTAYLSNALDDRYYHLERLHGEDGARLAAASHAAAIDQIDSIVRKERIDCRFQRLNRYLLVPPGQSAEVLEKELEAARRDGVEGVERHGLHKIAVYRDERGALHCASAVCPHLG